MLPTVMTNIVALLILLVAVGRVDAALIDACTVQPSPAGTGTVEVGLTSVNIVKTFNPSLFSHHIDIICSTTNSVTAFPYRFVEDVHNRTGFNWDDYHFELFDTA